MNNGIPQHEHPVTDTSLMVRQPAALTTPASQSPYQLHTAPPAVPGAEAVHLREYWRIINRRKKLVWLVVILGAMMGTLYAFHLKNVYTAKAIIEVKSDSPTLLGNQGFYFDAEYDLKTATQILQSRPLHTEIVKTMQLDKNNNFLDVTENRSLSETISAVFGKTKTPRSDRRILAGVFKPGTDEVKPLTPVTEPTTNEEEQNKHRMLVNTISGNLRIAPIRSSRLLTIEYSHTDPVLAAAIANAIAKTYTDNNFQAKTNKYTKTSDWLDRTTRGLKAKVEQAEADLGNYTKANNIFSIDNKTTLTTEKLSKLHEQATRAEADRILKNSLYQEVLQGRVEQLPDAFSDPKTNELKKKLGELSTQVALLEVKFGGRNPKVVEIRQQMAAIELQLKSTSSTLEEKLKADYDRAVRDEQSLNAALAKAKNEAAQENQAAIQFGMLRQNVETTKALYNDFMQKTTQAQAQVAEQYNNVEMIEPAEIPSFATGPKRVQTILLAFLLSTIAGVGLVLFIDYLDNTIKDADDILRYANFPTLAMVPTLVHKDNNLLGKKIAHDFSFVEKSSLLVSSDKNKTSLLALNSQLHDSEVSLYGIEAYRTLRTSILLSTAGGAPKKILFTSGLPGEGKSTTIINTALSLARLGRSVILIDADMRRPSIHKYFGLENNVGLSNYLSTDTTLEQATSSVGIPNLFIIPSGIIPPNAAELVSSESMRNMLAELSHTYDHVLIDSPPLMNVTDGLVISSMVDGVILLVSSGKCTRDVLRHCHAQLTKVNAKVLGAVLNNYSFEREGYGYYNRGYYGQYGAEPMDNISNRAA